MEVSQQIRFVLRDWGEDPARYVLPVLKSNKMEWWAYPRNGVGLLLRCHLSAALHERYTWMHHLRFHKGPVRERDGDLCYTPTDLVAVAFFCAGCDSLSYREPLPQDRQTDGWWYRPVQYARIDFPLCDACLIQAFPHIQGNRILLPRCWYEKDALLGIIARSRMLAKLLHMAEIVHARDTSRIALLESALFS